MNVEALRHDPLEDTQPLPVAERRQAQEQGREMHQACVVDEGHKLLAKLRERRKAATVGERAPQPDGSVDSARQYVVDFINEGSKHT